MQASHIGVGGHGWNGTGWLVVGVWSLVAGLLAGKVYRRDTKRV